MGSDQNKHSFNIKFEKDSHSLNVDTYVKSLTALNTMIKEVGYQVNPSGGRVEVQVVSEKPGSFDVVLAIAEAVSARDAVPMFTAGVGALTAIITLVVELIKIKEALGDKNNKTVINEGDKVFIKGDDNNVIMETNRNTYNIYISNQTINDALSAQFQAIKEDEEIEAITYNNDGDSVTIKRESFDALSKKQNIEVEDSKTSIVAATLVISKLVLDNKNRKWQFIHQGQRIGAVIEDNSFWDNVFSGSESFSNGDRLVCDLEIIRDYDDALGVYVDREYIVKNVRDHLKRESYEQLEF